MNNNNKIHFEVSERKVLLRIFDIIFVLSALYFAGRYFEFRIFRSFNSTHFYYAIVLAIYINSIGTVFEMYDLQVASNQFQVLKSSILTASTTVLFYLLTPIFSAELPSNRFEILIFYFTIIFALVFWRTFYVNFLASNRFVQNVLLVCDQEQVEELILDLENSDPHYRILLMLIQIVLIMINLNIIMYNN